MVSPYPTSPEYVSKVLYLPPSLVELWFLGAAVTCGWESKPQGHEGRQFTIQTILRTIRYEDLRCAITFLSRTCCWFQALTTCRISFSPLTKLLPLSERIFSGCPLLLMKRFKALMKGSVSKCGLLGRQGMLKSTPYLLTLLLPRRASNGPSSLLQHK